MLPELTERVKDSARRAFAGFGSKTLSLGLETKGSDWYQDNGFYKLAAQNGATGSTWSGESVTEQTALNHSTVFTCMRILAESVAALPLPLMREKDGQKDEAKTHPMFNALQHEPNAEITAQRFRETLMGQCVLGGNAYAQIMRRSSTGVAYELYPLLPSQVTIDHEKTGEKRLVYVVKDGNAPGKSFTVKRDKPQDILHVPGIGLDGVRGLSVLTVARQSIGTAIGAERHVGRFYGRGGRMPYNLKLNNDVFNGEEGEEQFKKFRSEWESTYADPNKAPIIQTWFDYNQTGVNLKDSQMLESRQFTVSEICRWFRISPHLAGDLSRATYSNIEQLAQEFKSFTLEPWIKRWEEELRRCILTPEEKTQDYYWKHNVNALLRGDFAARMAGYSTALQNGWLNRNEVRDWEDLNGFEGGDEYTIQLNMQPLPLADNAPAQQSQGLVRLGNGKTNRRVA